MVKNLLALSIFSGLFFGCKQDDITPSWLKIDAFQLTTNEATQGSNSHGITDAWVYLDSQPLGVYQVPCTIPILDKGEHDIIIFPGVKNNGISDTRVKYPFYNSYEEVVTLTLNDTVTISPTTTYKNSVKFAYIEDFEGAGISLTKSNQSDTDLVFIEKTDFPDLVVYGEKCGGIFLSKEDSVFATSTIETLVLPKAEEVYLELDYRNDNSITMGTIAIFPDGSTDQRTPFVLMNPQETGEEVWKKIYIDLKEDVSFETAASAFEIFFLSLIDDDNNVGTIYIDNVKVLHYQ